MNLIFDSRPFMYNKIFFEKPIVEVFWHLFGNLQIAAMEENCRRFRNSSECLNIRRASNNWPIWTQKVPKEA